ncbi:MAG: nucleotidyltransferase [Wendovervirus sonii]|uniref:Nucleotidyltransferase n=1 Tax=phage Lak_Megaphage_Sonny TaxID=3109229 RepID=A0ABZ0Z554_9CAUD|nr:MAG: nucleotidyltransferase [phage Lak_Megaphage_Sonny]
MRYYSKQPNNLYCCFSTITDDLSVINMTDSELKEEMKKINGQICEFDQILHYLKLYYPNNISDLRQILKNIGYDKADSFSISSYKDTETLQDNKSSSPYTFESIREKGLMLYEYIRGSQAYGLALPTSDEDRSAVYCAKIEDLMGLPEHYVNQVNDERNDVTWYEIGKYIELLCKANPTMLESLFVPEKCILYMHPAFKVIYDNRDMFVTKETFKSFAGYAKSQIEKARGLKKKIVNPITKRLTVLDFCHVPKGQGSQKIEAWLEERGLKQNYCGINNLDHMDSCHGVCYDYGTHLRCEYNEDTFNNMYSNANGDLFLQTMIRNKVLSQKMLDILDVSENPYEKILEMIQPKGYHGIMKANGKSNEIRLDSLIKYDQPICYLQYNKDGYARHCKEYKEYQEWVKMRNPQRYKENEGKEFDRKNMCHSFRLLNMGIEIARSGKVLVDRTNIDREFLLNIRLGNATYEELMSELTKKFEEFKNLIDECTLPETVDRNKVNQMLIDIRKIMYK